MDGCGGECGKGRPSQTGKGVNQCFRSPWDSCPLSPLPPALPRAGSACQSVPLRLRLSQYFENESYHAELCFLSWFHAKKLSPDEHYHITWFLSWSPCATCAEVVAGFLRTHQNVELSILAARLYYFWLPACRWGLQRLQYVGAQVAIMSYRGESPQSWGRAGGGMRTR